MVGLMLLLVCVVKRIRKIVVARLIVRLEVKLSSLGRAHLLSVVPFHLEGITENWRAHQNFSTSAPRRHFVPLHLQIASGATG